jgi:hypothetical protein
MTHRPARNLSLMQRGNPNKLKQGRAVKMTREDFFNSLVDLYLVCQDSASGARNPNAWTCPAMANVAGCHQLDDMIRAMVECGLLDPAQRERLYEMILSRMLYDPPQA